MSYWDDDYNDDKHWEHYWEAREQQEEEYQQEQDIKDEFESMMRIMLRTSTFKEDFMAYFWQPKRLNKMIEDGGWERVELYYKN
jgi:hypothetical protein